MAGGTALRPAASKGRPALFPNSALAMKVPRRRSLAAISLLLATMSFASGQNLLTNGGFEQGLQAWTPLSSSAASVSYGAGGTASVAVANRIGGGNKLARDLGGYAVIEQVVSTGALGDGYFVDASGFFGGFGTFADSAQLVIRFLDGTGFELNQRARDGVSAAQRNGEAVLLFRRGRFAVPSGTEQIAARIVFSDPCCNGTFGTADEIILELTTSPPSSAPHPLDTQLLVNGDFEAGHGPGSPLTLIHELSWEGIGGTARVKPYSDVDPSVPGTVAAAILDNGANLLSDESGAGGVRQLIDLRGNAPQVDAGLDFELQADLGGRAAFADHCLIQPRFLDEFFIPVGATAPSLGPVTSAMRNQQTVLLRRRSEYAIPPGTRFIELQVLFSDPCCNATAGMVDNVQAYLRTPAAPRPLPLGVNSLVNGSFESGSLPGSPLVIDDPRTWVGLNDATTRVPSYGLSGQVPSTSFAANASLGGLVLGHTGSAGLRQTGDLRGLASLIDQNGLRVDVRAWLGGYANFTDHATFTVQFFNTFGVPTGLPTIIGPVTAADRQNTTTLMELAESRLAPVGARSFSATVTFFDPCCNLSGATADGLEVVFSDAASVGTPYCYTQPNSTLAEATLRGTGSAVAAANNVTLIAEGLPPNQFGIFLTSPTKGFVQTPANNQGNLCLGGQIGRYNQDLLFTGPMGSFFLTLDLDRVPSPSGLTSVMAGEERNFQAWFRDVNPTPTSNLTRGLTILFE